MPISLPNWPNAKVEAYKYTNLAKLSALELGVGKSELRTSPQLANVKITPLAGQLSAMPDTPLVRRAQLQNDNGWNIEVEGTSEAPLELSLLSADNTSSTPKVLLKLGKNASLMLFEDCALGANSLSNQLWQIELADGAQLCHIRLQQCGDTATHLATSAVKVGRNASYKLLTLNTGANLARYEPHIELTAQGADVSLTGINLLTGTQHGDVTSVIRHTAPNGSSRQMIRNVLAGEARGVYQGQIVVAPHAQKTSAQQSSKALLLSPHAEMNTKPELEIFADDVQCSHGATTGAIDRNALYYLKARGVPEAQARALLVGGFIAEALDAVTNDSLRLRLDTQVSRWMERVS